jgi:small-conductance mechanosensitive channel
MNRLVLTRNQLDALTGVAWVIIAVAVGIAAHRIVYRLFARWAERRHSTLAAAVVRRTCRPAAYIFPLVAILAVAPQLVLPVVVTLVIVLALGAMLMTFPAIRTLGTTLLASAGVVGLVAGIAARPLFENLIAGVQLALTQPIRIDDVVVVENQFGRIEEIHSTYVVVRVWDLRRLVLPLTYFITTPFENWTRRTANLIGEVYLFADYAVDVAALRAHLPRILEATPLWDGQTQTVEVTDATDRAVQIRALVSARDSGTLWNLRCYVREALVAYLRDTQPSALPRLRLVEKDVAETARDDLPRQRTGNDGVTEAERHSGE